MLKGDNVGINYRVLSQCVEGESFTFKAIVNNKKEYIIAENISASSSYPPNAVNLWFADYDETINWIVP